MLFGFCVRQQQGRPGSENSKASPVGKRYCDGALFCVRPSLRPPWGYYHCLSWGGVREDVSLIPTERSGLIDWCTTSNTSSQSFSFCSRGTRPPAYGEMSALLSQPPPISYKAAASTSHQLRFRRTSLRLRASCALHRRRHQTHVERCWPLRHQVLQTLPSPRTSPSVSTASSPRPTQMQSCAGQFWFGPDGGSCVHVRQGRARHRCERTW